MTTKIILENLYSTVETEDHRVLASLHNRLAVPDPNANFSPAYKSGMWDGMVRFYDAKKRKFPTGLLTMAYKCIKRYDDDIEIIDKRQDVYGNVPIPESIKLAHKQLGSITLRDYQHEGVEKALTKSRGIINIATNGGKCITKDSYILTSQGYKTVDTIFKENGTPCENKDVAIEASVDLINRYGKVETSSHLTFNGVKKVINVALDSGLEMNNTHNHPVLVLSEDGEFVWSNTEDLKVGDSIVTRVGDEVYGTDDTVSPEEAYLIGALVADAYLEDDYKVSFTNDQYEILYPMEEYFKSLGAKKVWWEDNLRSNTGSTSLCMSGVSSIRAWKDAVKLKSGVAKDKEVPTTIMNAPKEVQIGFLSGYFECECDIDTSRPRVEVTSASKKLLSEIQIMLKNMGILSTLKEKPNKKYPGVYYGRLAVLAVSNQLFLSMLNFKSESRVEQLHIAIDKNNSTKKRPSKDNVPNGKVLMGIYKDTYPNPVGGMKKKMHVPSFISRTKARALLDEFPHGEVEIKSLLQNLLDENIYFDEVTSLTDAGEQETFDVCMPETHSFICNSVVNHNTEIACGVLQQLLPVLRPGKHLVFLTGSKEIFDQSHKRISERLGIKVGKIGDGKWDIQPITVVMIPSVSRYLTAKAKGKADPKKYKEKHDLVMDFIKNTDGFIADEVHHASSESWFNLIMKMENAYYRLGMTGTVGEKDSIGYMRLVSSTGRILIKVSNDFLIKEGYSAKPVIHLHRHDASSFNEPYGVARKIGIVHSSSRNAKICQDVLLKSLDNEQCLVIVNETEHGNVLMDKLGNQLHKMGVQDLTVDFIHGECTSAHRNGSLEKFAKGEINVLIATSIMDEGVDISGINCIFLAAGGKSSRQVLQRIGRGLRKKSDGSGVEVHDYIDDHNGYLMNHTQERISVYRQQKFDIIQH